MTDVSEQSVAYDRRAEVLAHLRYCLTKDIARNSGDGSRTTRDVAEAIYLTMAATRRLLWALAEDGQIEAADGGASGTTGNPIYWRAIPTQTSAAAALLAAPRAGEGVDRG